MTLNGPIDRQIHFLYDLKCRQIIQLAPSLKYAPRPDHEAPIPDWKRNPVYCDALPERDLVALAAEQEKSNPE